MSQSTLVDSPDARSARGSGAGAPARALITGATGFLGAHLLYELLDCTSLSVTCLVRGESDGDAHSRLVKRLRGYFRDFASSRHEGRFQVVAGDISAPALGLSATRYEELAAQHQCVFNLAADVRHVGTRAHFIRMNTDSVAALIAFARRGAPKHLHHVSSVAVRGRVVGATAGAKFSERDLEQGQVFPSHPYAESKFLAERLLVSAIREGLSGTIYRVGNIGPHSETGNFQDNIQGSDFACYLRAAIRLGLAPYRPDTKVRLTPVDSMAKAIRTLAMSDENRGQTYYVDSPFELRHYDVIRALQALGYSIRLIDAEHFAEQALALADDDASLAMMLPAASLEHGTALPIDATLSESVLGRLGFAYPHTSDVWLGKFLDQAIEREFFEPPRFWRAGSLVRGFLADAKAS